MTPQLARTGIPRVTAPFVQPLVDAAHACQIDTDGLASSLGFSYSLSPLPEEIPVDDYIALLEALANASGSETFGLSVGAQVRLSSYTVYGMILMACPTVGNALQAVMRYEGLAHDLGTSALRISDQFAEYRWESPYAHRSPHLAPSIFSGILVFAKWLLGPTVKAHSISFAQAAPVDMTPWNAFFDCEVEFEAQCNAAKFDVNLLQQPVPHSDARFFEMLAGHAEGLLQARLAVTKGFLDQVREHIVRALTAGSPRIDSIAQSMDMSVRSLQRHLQAEGWRFQALLDETRKSLAMQYVADPGMRLTDIAFLLGFSEQSSFNHAFREWLGMSPKSWRTSANNK